jgi:signal transduction histidine kinase
LSVPALAGPPRANWVLSLEETRARDVQVFVVDPGGGDALTADWTIEREPARGGAMTRYPAFEFRAEQLSGRSIYLRVASRSSMRAMLWLTPAQRFAADYARDALLFGALTGLLLAIAVYCVALGAAVGELSLVLLAAAAIACAAYVIADRRFVETLLIEGASSLSRAMSFGGTFAIYLTAVLFSAVYLRAPVEGRIGRWVVFGLSGALGCATLLAIFDAITDGSHLRPVSGALGVTAILSVIGLGVRTLFAYPARAGLYFACWSPALIGGLMRPALDAFPGHFAASRLAVFAVYPGFAGSMLFFAVLTSFEARQRFAHARRELAASERRFHDYSLTASDFFWEADRSGVVTRVSAPARRELRLTVGESFLLAVARSASGIDRSGPDELASAFANRRPFRGVRLALAATEAGERHILVNGLPIEDPSDPGAAWRGTMSDVTEEVMRERERNRERTMVSLGVMVGSIAHEINNLLHPIVNLSRLAMERVASDEETRRLLGIVNESGRRASEIVANVLGLARVRAESDRAPFGQAVAEALVTLETLGGAQISVESRVDTFDGPEIRRTQAFQVLSNLLNNAAKAMDFAGAVGVHYRELERVGDRRRFALVVSDSGSGMSEAVRRRALEPLFTASKDEAGAGLGLAIVRSIVESVGGCIEIESRLGKGARVTISLTKPLREASRPEIPHDDAA